MQWRREDEDPVTYTYSGEYLLTQQQGIELAEMILQDIGAGKHVVIDLDAGTHCIHHHFYYGLLSTCIEAGRGDLFTPGSNLTVVHPPYLGVNTWEHVLKMYREKGFL